MSRVSEIISLVKKDLGQYNQRDVNISQILFAMNKGQTDIIMTENFLEKKITFDIVNDLVAGTDNQYSLQFSNQSIVKKVVSAYFPDTWGKIIWCTPQQFDENQTYFNNHPADYTGTNPSSLTYPLFVTIRGGNIEFLAAPQDPAGTTFTLGVWLSKQSQDASLTVEPEIPSQYDTALRYYADWYLLPIEHPARDKVYSYFNNEIKRFEGILNNTDSYPRSPNPIW